MFYVRVQIVLEFHVKLQRLDAFDTLVLAAWIWTLFLCIHTIIKIERIALLMIFFTSIYAKVHYIIVNHEKASEENKSIPPHL